MEKYENLGVIGEGSYGVVIKCRNKESSEYVAVKKFLECDDDKNVKKIALREIRILKKLRHSNLISLLEVFRRKHRLYLVFEYMEHTMLELLQNNPEGLGVGASSNYIFQVLSGLEFCHKENIIHRDIKPENVLVSSNGVVKLCDFGFARLITTPVVDQYTDYVATRWYRAPELLVGEVHYGKEVDVWAVGCLFSEMMTSDPLFPGESDVDQLFLIVKTCGSLTCLQEEVMAKNPLFNGVRFLQDTPPSLSLLFPNWPKEAVQFLEQCLHIEPCLRPSCKQLLTHDLMMLRGIDDNSDKHTSLVHFTNSYNDTKSSADSMQYRSKGGITIKKNFDFPGIKTNPIPVNNIVFEDGNKVVGKDDVIRYRGIDKGKRSPHVLQLRKSTDDSNKNTGSLPLAFLHSEKITPLVRNSKVTKANERQQDRHGEERLLPYTTSTPLHKPRHILESPRSKHKHLSLPSVNGAYPVKKSIKGRLAPQITINPFVTQSKQQGAATLNSVLLSLER